ncbi:polysaccharide deacetylase family protein [Ferruginibacter albus]|uniref:polysaccharide deacetylase family protein n=1 Tax=Ferruginibacter albus TaxID=2875540 RepID=UPI001CC5C8AD|nr:polysaccharide deacetylase family protein [Ferruginibacter albus]UAY52219.1 polysaccharide deacetylase family protein [Ferruginibacter albus]
MKNGIFTISLDFELHWGVSETKTVQQYYNNLAGTRNAIDKMLQLFAHYNIHVTWATVGMLFCKDKHELLNYCNQIDQPNYANKKLNNFDLAKKVGENHTDDPFHFGNDLIPKIIQTKNQEIGTHTFSHYYCLERGQTAENFKSDINAVIDIAKENNISIASIVFPRNQYNGECLHVCKQSGIKAYRGNEKHWMYQPLSREKETKYRRLLRLIDTYINISGNNTHEINYSGELVNVPASRFLRPFNPKLKFIEALRLRRIKKEMTFAAKNKRLYHLWWHPHNFGINQDINFAFLEKILQHFSYLESRYNFQSKNISEVCYAE